ncbi:FAD dependent oxidoreductase superfamily [Beauveria brongniartii RCEF 3172]|uniref:FAD dependent oxidoreductase superfamily n=1 Tax=Beauveria brongniartii RCEF 3172 TaxID=1081107 RepID=A0A167BJF3_9HYPO|nr:FAD dependent oxidoreductase superfamily [Beauveria brongniartii RCEF 3172]
MEQTDSNAEDRLKKCLDFLVQNPGFAVATAARNFGVTRGTLRRRLDGITPMKKGRHSPNTKLTEEEEEKLSSEIRRLNDNNVSTSKQWISDAANRIIRARSSDVLDLVTSRWVDRFITRHGLYVPRSDRPQGFRRGLSKSEVTEKTSKHHVAVIGAGVIGLSITLHLIRRGYTVTVATRELPGDWDIDYASPPRRRPLSAQELKRIAGDPDIEDAGVAFITAVEYFDTTPTEDELDMFAVWPEYRLLEPDEMPTEGTAKGIKAGLTYSAWVIDTLAYLGWLQGQAESLGAIFVRSRLGAVQEAAFVAQEHRPDLAMPKIVVNASGTGFGDTKCFPTRSQYMLISNSYHSTVSHHSADGHTTVVIPRPFGGTVIGGTIEPHNWSPNNSRLAIEKILRRVAAVCPDLLQAPADDPSLLPAINVRQAYIGRIPMRKGGLRLEKEVITINLPSEDSLDNELSSMSIVHCYGAGPNGFKIGWAIASRATSLVN